MMFIRMAWLVVISGGLLGSGMGNMVMGQAVADTDKNKDEGPMDREIRIAMCQIIGLDGDREGNYARIERALIRAVSQGAHIACFPETVLLGWVNPDAHRRAEPIPGKDTDRLGALARKYKVYLCVGLAEKQEQHLYDSVVLIGKGGELLARHRKINILTELMQPPYTPGQSVGVVETEFGRIGLLICADTFREDLLARMRNERPDLVLVPYGWAAPESKWPEHGKELEKTVIRAARNLACPVIGTDVVGAITHGPWRGWVYGGQSIAVDAAGRILGRGCDRDCDVVIVTVRLKRPANP